MYYVNQKKLGVYLRELREHAYPDKSIQQVCSIINDNCKYTFEVSYMYKLEKGQVGITLDKLLELCMAYSTHLDLSRFTFC